MYNNTEKHNTEKNIKPNIIEATNLPPVLYPANQESSWLHPGSKPMR